MYVHILFIVAGSCPVYMHVHILLYVAAGSCSGCTYVLYIYSCRKLSNMYICWQSQVGDPQESRIRRVEA